MRDNVVCRVLSCLGGVILGVWGPEAARAAEPAPGVPGKPTCAVVAFEAVAPVKAAQSDLLANRYATVLAGSMMFSVMPRLEMYEVLREKGCLRSSYRALEAFAKKAGETLGVDYVIYGTLQRADDDSLELTVNILDVRRGTIAQTQKTQYPKDLIAAPPPAAEVPPPVGAPTAVTPPAVIPVAPPVAPPASSRPAWFGVWTPDESRAACAWTWERCARGRLEPGLRMTHFHFISPSHVTYDAYGNILGGYVAGISTYSLEEKQSGDLDLYLRYWFLPRVGLQAAWESVRGRAWTLDTADPHYDGDMVLSGPSLLLMARYPNKTRCTPYAGVGLAWLQGDFREEASWSAGGWRNMSASDTTGTLVSLGCEVKIWRRLQADFTLSYLNAESDAAWWYLTDTAYRAQWTWPADSYLTQLGLTYAF